MLYTICLLAYRFYLMMLLIKQTKFSHPHISPMQQAYPTIWMMWEKCFSKPQSAAQTHRGTVKKLTTPEGAVGHTNGSTAEVSGTQI